MNQNDIKLVSALIYKQVIGKLEPDEAEMLNNWRQLNEANEILYQKLIDNENLEMEFNRLKQIKVERPLNDMKSRIKRRHKLVSFFRWGIAATILVLMVWGSIKLYNQQIENELLKKELCARKIQPGQTQATLVLSNGKSIDLGMNSTENQKKLVMQKQKLSAKLTNKEKHKGAKNNLLITPKGGEFKIILEDSTEVWLNAESKLVYPEFFGKDERRVTVQGEAFFKVKKNLEKPFLVETDGQLLKVYGTEFNIRSYKEDKDVYTTLVSGSISIRPMNGNQGELIITPDNQAMFRKVDETTTIRKVNTEVITSWKDGMFVFEEQNLEQIMQTLSRWYNFTYIFNDEQLKNIVFMGSINRYAEFDDVIKILEMSGGIHFDINERHISISKRK